MVWRPGALNSGEGAIDQSPPDENEGMAQMKMLRVKNLSEPLQRARSIPALRKCKCCSHDVNHFLHCRALNAIVTKRHLSGTADTQALV
jgi:hypothetical protein